METSRWQWIPRKSGRTPGPPIGSVETRSLTGDSTLGILSGTYVTALTAPSEDTAIIVAGADTPALATSILGSIRER